MHKRFKGGGQIIAWGIAIGSPQSICRAMLPLADNVEGALSMIRVASCWAMVRHCAELQIVQSHCRTWGNTSGDPGVSNHGQADGLTNDRHCSSFLVLRFLLTAWLQYKPVVLRHAHILAKKAVLESGAKSCLGSWSRIHFAAIR